MLSLTVCAAVERLIVSLPVEEEERICDVVPADCARGLGVLSSKSELLLLEKYLYDCFFFISFFFATSGLYIEADDLLVEFLRVFVEAPACLPVRLGCIVVDDDVARRVDM